MDIIKYYKIDTLLSLDIRYKKEEIPNKRNMNMFIQSDGEIKYNYTKHNLLPFAEFDNLISWKNFFFVIEYTWK